MVYDEGRGKRQGAKIVRGGVRDDFFIS